MDILKQRLRQMAPNDMNSLFIIFVGSMLGTLGTALFLSATTAGMDELSWYGRLLLSISAAIIYGGIVGGTFYVLLPRRRK